MQCLRDYKSGWLIVFLAETPCKPRYKLEWLDIRTNTHICNIETRELDLLDKQRTVPTYENKNFDRVLCLK